MSEEDEKKLLEKVQTTLKIMDADYQNREALESFKLILEIAFEKGRQKELLWIKKTL